jgi:hypothetical protein
LTESGGKLHPDVVLGRVGANSRGALAATASHMFRLDEDLSGFYAVVSADGDLRSAHVVRDDGCRRSGGAAVADALSVLPPTRVLGRLARSLPRTTASLYGVVAARRKSVGLLVGNEARRRADDLLGATSAITAAELTRRDRRANELGVR